MIFSLKVRLKIVQKKMAESKDFLEEIKKQGIDYSLYPVLRCVLFLVVL